MSAGTVTVGGPSGVAFGVTSTVKVAVALRPALLVAVQVTVVVAIAKVEPEAGVQSTGSVPSAKSVAVGVV